MNNYIQLDYYKNFKCKCGECRSSCCEGWNVSVTLQEYFKLNNLECTEYFRKKLNDAFYIELKPTIDHYAIIKKNYEGDCVFHGNDGLCELHKNFGEQNIPSICNFYPRYINKEMALERSCSNSCEKVLEMLFENDLKLEIEYYETDDQLINANKEYELSRKKMIEVLQTRSMSLKEKIYEISKKDINFDSKKIDNEILIDYLRLYNKSPVAKEIVEQIDAITNDLNNYSYDILLKHVYNVIPSYDIYLEKYLINHIFFTNFPYDKLIGKYDYYIHSLVGVYELSKYVTVMLMKDKQTKSELIDILAFLYRLIGHSNFHKEIGKYLYSKIGKDILGIL